MSMKSFGLHTGLFEPVSGSIHTASSVQQRGSYTIIVVSMTEVSRRQHESKEKETV